MNDSRILLVVVDEPDVLRVIVLLSSIPSPSFIPKDEANNHCHCRRSTDK